MFPFHIVCMSCMHIWGRGRGVILRVQTYYSQNIFKTLTINKFFTYMPIKLISYFIDTFYYVHIT